MRASTPIARADLAVRTRAALQAAGIRTLGQADRLTDAELLALPHFTRACLDDLKFCLEAVLRGPLSGKSKPNDPVRGKGAARVLHE